MVETKTVKQTKTNKRKKLYVIYSLPAPPTTVNRVYNIMVGMTNSGISVKCLVPVEVASPSPDPISSLISMVTEKI